MMAWRWSGGIAPLSLVTTWILMVRLTLWPPYPLGKSCTHQRTHLLGDWLVPIIGLDVLEENIYCLYGDSKLGCPVRLPSKLIQETDFVGPLLCRQLRPESKFHGARQTLMSTNGRGSASSLGCFVTTTTTTEYFVTCRDRNTVCVITNLAK